MKLIDELRDKFPGLATKSRTSPLAAIRLHCLECCGGSRKEVEECTAPECVLFGFRLGTKPKRGAKLALQQPRTKKKRVLTEEHKRKLVEGRKKAKMAAVEGKPLDSANS